MNIFKRGRAALVTTAVAGAGLAGLLGTGAAQASTASHTVAGYVTFDTCTSAAGQITYSPGLRSTLVKPEQAVLTGTIAGCSNIDLGPWLGTGTISAVMSGNASKAAENFTGTFTINWPVSSGFNPSTGTLTATESNGIEQVSGTVTSGPGTGYALGLQYVITGSTGTGTKKHPVKAQTYTNTTALTISGSTG